MKKVILFLTLMTFSLNSFCQTAVEEQKLLDNTYYGVFGSATSPLNFNSVFPINSGFGAKIGKNFSPIFGAQIEGLTTLENNPFESSNAFKLVNVGANGTVNLLNLFFKQKNRVIDINTVAGLGWMHLFYPGNDNNFFSSKTGLNVTFNLPAGHSLFVEPNILWKFDEAFKYNKHNAQMGISVGYLYTINRGFKKYDIGAYNRTIENLNTEINSLREELAKKPKETVRIIKEVSMTSVVFFAKNSDVLTDDAKRILNTYTSKDSVVLEGYASIEGSADYNKKLSERRALAVKNYLESNGVTILSCEGKGVLNETTGRVVIVKK